MCKVSTETGIGPKLTVAISVIEARLESLTLEKLPVTSGVVYLLLLQMASVEQAQSAASRLAREDVSVVFLDSVGASNSRNAALTHTKTELLLFADDDTTLINEAFPLLIDRFEEQHQISFFLGRLRNINNELHKTYPAEGTKVRKTNSGRVGTPELSIRVKRFHEHGLTFDPSFGAGTDQPFGEEYIFICDALAKGLEGAFVELDLAVHAGKSTGQRMLKGSAQLRQAVLRRALGRASWVYRVGYAFKHRSIFDGVGELVRFIKP